MTHLLPHAGNVKLLPPVAQGQDNRVSEEGGASVKASFLSPLFCTPRAMTSPWMIFAPISRAWFFIIWAKSGPVIPPPQKTVFSKSGVWPICPPTAPFSITMTLRPSLAAAIAA
jgi:hypothetical protein